MTFIGGSHGQTILLRIFRDFERTLPTSGPIPDQTLGHADRIQGAERL